MAQYKLFLTFTFTFAQLTSIVVAIDEPCPQIEVIKYFNLTAFSGKIWYEVARYTNNIEQNGECASLVIYYDNGDYKVNKTEIVDGNVKFINGYLTNDEKQPGIIYLRSLAFKDDEVNNKFPVKVLEADCDNFFFAYDCRYNETTKTRHEYAWVLSASRKLEGKSKKEFDELMKSHNYIDINKLVWEHFSEDDCKIKAKSS